MSSDLDLHEMISWKYHPRLRQFQEFDILWQIAQLTNSIFQKHSLNVVESQSFLETMYVGH